MLVLKQVMQKSNQDFAISLDIARKLKDQGTAQARLFNWNFLCQELEVSKRYIVTVL